MGGPVWLSDLCAEGNRILDMQPGWDGPGSGVPTLATVTRMVALISGALQGLADAKAPSLTPAGDGSLQAEWHRVHARFEFCIHPDEPDDAYAEDHLAETKHEATGTHALAMLTRWAPWVATSPSTPHQGAA